MLQTTFPGVTLTCNIGPWVDKMQNTRHAWFALWLQGDMQRRDRRPCGRAGDQRRGERGPPEAVPPTDPEQQPAADADPERPGDAADLRRAPPPPCMWKPGNWSSHKRLLDLECWPRTLLSHYTAFRMQVPCFGTLLNVQANVQEFSHAPLLHAGCRAWVYPKLGVPLPWQGGRLRRRGRVGSWRCTTPCLA